LQTRRPAEIPHKIRKSSKYFLRRPFGRYPIPGLPRRRRVRAPRSTSLPSTKPMGETRTWLPPACGPLRLDCRDGVRATVRAREWPLDVHLQGVRRFLPATPERAELYRKSPAREKSATIASRSVASFLRYAPSGAALPLRVPPVRAPRLVRLRKFSANAHTIRKGPPRIRTATLLLGAGGADGSDSRKRSWEWPEESPVSLVA